MIYGQTDLRGAQPGSHREEMQPLSATPQCASPPANDTLRPYRGLQGATRKQANDLGILFQKMDGSPAPFLTGHVVLWRAGQYGTCTSVSGTTELVYGTELIVAFLLAPDQNVPRIIAQLEHEITHRKVRAMGVTLNGSRALPVSQQEMKEVASDVLNSGSIQRFTALQKIWSNPPRVVSKLPLGILVSSFGS